MRWRRKDAGEREGKERKSEREYSNVLHDTSFVLIL
jgi:hypothetical protein